MALEPWRYAACDLMPAFRDRIDAAEDISSLWVELWDCEIEGRDDEPLTHAELASLFCFASWCLLSRDEECQDAAIVEFYEVLPTNPRIRDNLHRYLTVEDFEGLKGLFEYYLTPEEHAELVEEFMRKAALESGSQSQIEGEA